MPQAIGTNIDIGKLSKAIQEADNGLKNLQKTSDNVTKSINKAFESVAQGGVQQLSQTIEALNKRLQNLGNISSSKNVSNLMDGIGKSTENAIDKVNRLSRQMEGLMSGNMSNNAGTLGKLALGDQLQKVDQELNQVIARYKELQNEFTHLSVPAGNNSAMKAIQDEVQFVIECRKLLETEKDAILKAQASLEKAQKTLSQKDPFKAKIDDLGRESLEAMRYKDAMNAMREFYAEEERQVRESEKNRQKYLNTPKGAMEFAQKAMNEERSIKALKEAISHLEKAQESVNTRTKKGKKEFEQLGNQIRQTKKALSELTGESKEFSARFKGIGSTIAAAFSVHTIRGFVNQLITIRGEFELQHRSLQILIGDLDKANEIWDKNVSLAVKSPFRVKELVTYTKQLAAYRVEADKLYETNRMLADVSAGLGVDMNRLILAFGQVKAANFLRGTELRQFSEAGVNILDELAKRFSAFEGRVVSVGEVFERVSKRMVSFKDVEAVFQTITSKGGVFYQMQEKQSETTRGMIMNLKDSIDLMFNEIGQESDGIIKGSIRLVKQLIDNWRMFKPVIETTGVALMTYFGAKALMKIANGVKAIINAFNTHPIIAVISLVSTLATFIWRCAESASALTAAMNRIDIEATKQLQDSIDLYRELAEEVRDVTTTTEERNEAMAELKTKFGEILPDQYLELEYIKGISDNYDAATDAMVNYYNSKAMQQKKDKIETEFNEELYETDIPELIQSTYNLIDDATSKFSDMEKVKLKSGAAGIINKYVEDIKTGARKLPATMFDMMQEVETELAKWADVSVNKFGMDYGFFEDIEDLLETLKEYQIKKSYIAPLPSASWEKEVAANALVEYKGYIKQLEDASNQLFNLADKFSERPEGRDATEQIMAIVGSLDLPDNMMNKFQPLLLEYANELFLGAKGGKFEFNALSSSVQEKWQATLALIWSGLAETTYDSSVTGASQLADLMWNEAEKKVIASESIALNDFQKQVTDVFRDVAKEMKIDKGLFADFIPDTTKAVGDLIKDLKKLEEDRTEAVKAWDKVISEGASIEEAEAIRTISNDTIEAWRKSIPALAEAANRLGYVPKKENKDKNKDIQERIKVIEDMHKKYEELNKTLSESESLEGAFKAYKDAFATAYGREDVRKMSGKEFVEKVLNFPNEDEVVKWFDDLEKQVSDKKDKMKVSLAKGKFVMDATVRLKKDADEELKKQIEGMFDRYDTTKEFDKLKAPEGFLKSLFGIDSMSLEQLRAELTAMEDEFIGKDRQKDYEEFLKKLDDLERKELEEKAKKFVDYLKKNLDAIENVQRGRGLDIAFAQQLFEEGKISAEVFGEAIQAIVKETNKEISKLNLDKFKESPEYIQAMGDMTAYSASELRTLSERLKGVIAENGHAFSAEELKVYHDALEKVNKRLTRLDRNFVYDKDIRNLRELKRLNEEVAQEKEKEIGLNQKLIEQEIYRDSLVASLERLQKDRRDAKSRGEDTTIVDANILHTQRDLEKANDDVEQTKASLNHSKGLIAELGAELNTILNNETEAFAKLTAYVNVFNKSLEAFTTVFNDVKGVIDSFGVDTETGFWAETGVAIEALANVGGKAASAATKFASGDIFGGVVDSVGAIFEAIKGVNETIDATYESTITAKLKEIEDLGLAYERLEKNIDEAYNANDLARYNAEMEENIDLQLRAYEAALKAEEAKKDTDPERVKELTQSYNELSESWEEFKKSQLEDMGSVTDFRDATSGFVDAWYNAFQETGNGLDGLKDNFRDFFKDVVKQQALTKGATAIMSQLYETINKSLEGDYSISDAEYQNIDDVQEKVLRELDAFLNGYYERYGDILSESEGGKLSELQKGISGMSEQQAEILTAYWNSVRGYTASIDSKMDLILANMGVGAENNPMLEQLISQTSWLSKIHNILDGLTTSSPGVVGRRIKVTM